MKPIKNLMCYGFTSIALLSGYVYGQSATAASSVQSTYNADAAAHQADKSAAMNQSIQGTTLGKESFQVQNDVATDAKASKTSDATNMTETKSAAQDAGTASHAHTDVHGQGQQSDMAKTQVAHPSNSTQMKAAATPAQQATVATQKTTAEKQANAAKTKTDKTKTDASKKQKEQTTKDKATANNGKMTTSK